MRTRVASTSIKAVNALPSAGRGMVYVRYVLYACPPRLKYVRLYLTEEQLTDLQANYSELSQAS